MGMVFGVIKEETPKFTVLKRTATFEVRRYQPSIIAETVYATNEMGKNAGQAFGRLARYIGVFSDAQNRSHSGESEKLAMTAPVLMAPSGGGGGPSSDGGGGAENANTPMLAGEEASKASLLPGGQGKMSFLLPATYTTVEAAPTPTDTQVVLRQLPERVQAVKTFTWSLSEENIRKNLQALVSDLANDNEWQGVGTGHGHDLGGLEWCAAGYNAPFCLPWARTNEVMVSARPLAGAEAATGGGAESAGQHIAPPRL